MAFLDIFEEQRKKLNNYFGLGQPGLGTFGKQVSNVIKPTVSKNIQNYQKAGRYLSSQPTLAQRYTPVVGPIRSLMNIKRDIQNPQSYQRQMITGVGRTTADIANLAQKINIPSQIANRVLPEKLTPQYNVNRFRNFVYSQPRATTLEGKIGSFIGENAPYFAIPTGGSANYGSKTFSSLARSTPKVMQKIPLMQAAKIAGRKELLANIGREAVQGAGFMGGLAIGQDKSPKEIAKDILIGAGFGAGARLGMAGAGAVVGKVADKVKLQQAINSIKNPELRLQVNKEIGLLQSKPAFAKLPINPKKPSQPIVGANKGIETKIPKELEPLAQEARKYKSAEEFMEAQARYKDYRAIHEAVREGKLKVGDITTTRAYGGEVVEIVPPEYTGELNDIGHPIRYRIQTKSELVDIWKKANAAQSLPEPKIKIKEAEIKPKPVQPATNIPKELEPLAKEDLYNQATKGANKGIDALRAEARKYKSAEEFVKAQGTPVYRGQNSSEFTMGGKSAGIGKSFTTDKNVAEVYGNQGKIIDGFVNNKDILRYDELDGNTKKYIKSIIDEKIDRVKIELENENIKPFEELVLELGEIARIKNKKAIDISSFGIPSESEIRILSKDALKTKSQLTDIWNKSQSPTPKTSKIPLKKDFSPQSTQGVTPKTAKIPLKAEKPPKPPVKPPRTFEPEPPSNAFEPYKTNQPAKDDGLFLKARETFQDKMIRQRNIQQGANVADNANPYQAEELFHGRVASRIEKAKGEFEGIFRRMNDYSNNAGLKLQELRGAVNKYLHATHAPERNLQHGAGAAGMTDDQAKAILGEISSSPHAKAVQEFAVALRTKSDETLDILKDGGLLSQEQVDLLRKTYKNHVPLQRIMDEDDVFSSLSGKGFDVKSSGLKRAVGSEREVDDIAGNILANLEQATVRAEKNRVGLNVLEFARTNKDLDMFEISGPKTIGKTFDDKFISDKNLPENALSVFENGKQKIITIKDEKLAKALKGVNVEQVPALLRPIAAMTRFFSAVATRYNPEFVLSNIVRDSQELAVYIASQADLPKGSVSAVTKEIPASLNDVRKYLKGDLSSEGTKLYKQMIEDGGTTGGMGLSTRGQVQLDIAQMEKLVKSKPRQAAKKAVEAIDGWNQIFEDSTRLAAYKQAIKSGLSRERAASIAKNATINFNRKGTAGTIVNSLYMFANASIQGSVKVLTSMKNPKVAAATIAAVAGPTWAINRMNDSVDPDWRDKVSEWDRRSNLVIMLPSSEGSKYITIPVSWGLKPIKVIADQTYDVATGKSGDAYETAGKIASSFVDAYNPVGGTDITSAITPSALDVPVEIARNKKWSGSMIRNDKELVPNHQNYFSSLNNSLLGRSSIATTEKIADTTNNRISINPADMAYAIQQYIGGAGRSVERFGSTIANTLQGKATEAKNIPFVNRFVKTQDQEQVEKNLTYKDRGGFEKQLKKMKAGSDEQRDFVQEYLWNQPKEDRQGIMYGLQLKGVYTKGLTVKDKAVALKDRAIEEKGNQFLQSGKKELITDDYVFEKADTDKGYKATPRIDYEIDLRDGDYGILSNLKKNKDFEGWMKEADLLVKMYEEKLKDPDITTKEKMELEGKIRSKLTEMQKYAGYGGFDKPKKGKKINISVPDLGSAKIPVKRAGKFAFKTSSAPKINIVSTKPKQITKSYLASIR